MWVQLYACGSSNELYLEYSCHIRGLRALFQPKIRLKITKIVKNSRKLKIYGIFNTPANIVWSCRSLQTVFGLLSTKYGPDVGENIKNSVFPIKKQILALEGKKSVF